MKFNWQKKGLICDGSTTIPKWANNSALTPTPFLLNENTIRIYAGFRDIDGVSRVGFIDVDKDTPQNIKNISSVPVLDIGQDGCFDDNGVILGDIIKVQEKIHMYYVGFQLVKKAKFLAFSGLAISDDNGDTFKRFSKSPILDRRNNANTINAIHTILQINDKYRVWYAVGDDWEYINGKPFPRYNIWTATSNDGVHINDDALLCVDVKGEEYRIGRPSVIRINDEFVMLYTKGTRNGIDYFPGMAFSADGVHWTRDDAKFGLKLSETGWDSSHIAYPRLLKISDSKYHVFYNGNNMGREGFGYAELIVNK